MKLNSILQLIDLYADHAEEILFVFDVDFVITMSADMAYHPLTVKKHKNELLPLLESLSNEHEELVYSLIAHDTHRVFVEEAFPEVLTRLHAAGHRSMALTAQLALVNEDLDTIQRRLDELHSLGVIFEHAFHGIQPFWLKEVPKFLGSYPHYREGILFSNSTTNPKGEILKSFLKRAGYGPKKIVFIDDMLKNVESVRSTFVAEGIACDAWHYTAIYAHQEPEIGLKEALEKWLEKIERARFLIAQKLA